jgi:hypothetical protein
LRLLRQLVDDLVDGAFPIPRGPAAVQELLASRVQRNVNAMQVPLQRQHRLGGDGAMIEQPFELCQLLVDQMPENRRDLNMTTGEFEAHINNSQLPGLSAPSFCALKADG